MRLTHDAFQLLNNAVDGSSGLMSLYELLLGVHHRE